MAFQFTILFILITIPLSIANDGETINLLKKAFLSAPQDWNSPNFCNWTGVQCHNSRIISINLHSKSIKGTLIEEIKNLTQLKMLSLPNCRLYGTLPSLANMSLLEEINLSYNNLTGSIPQTWTSLTSLQIVDLSYNNLTGVVPHFLRTVNFSWTGNLLLPQYEGNSVNSVLLGPIIGGVIGGLVIIGMVLIVAYWCYIERNQPRLGRVPSGNQATEMIRSTAGISNPGFEMPVFDIEILRNATNNFSEENKLGSGGYAAVYRGVVNGTTVAVKRMDSRSIATPGLTEFQAEIDALTRVRHRNLVALLGYCITAEERILVYKYMSKGTLSQHLFEPEQNGYSRLDWLQRIAIALGVARGIEYLHSGTQQILIHRDLKPSNILLDDDMRAKVSDFGLVKIVVEGNNSTVHTRVAGTIGYLAPECLETITVTRKADVYSFGVILMELITGRRALDETKPEDEQAIVRWFRTVFVNLDNPGTLLPYIDPTVEANQETIEGMLTVVQLALNCTNRQPQQRPDMSYAVTALREIIRPHTVPVLEEDTASTSLVELLVWEDGEGTSSEGEVLE